MPYMERELIVLCFGQVFNGLFLSTFVYRQEALKSADLVRKYLLMR